MSTEIPGTIVVPGVGLADPTLALGLNGIADWSAELPFLDLMKQARPWQTEQPGDDMNYAMLEAAGYLDEHGWPIAIPEEADSINTVWTFPEGTAGAEGPFVLTWEGEGELRIEWVDIISSEPGRIVFNNTGGDTFWLKISATDPDQTGDYIRDIRIVPAEYEALADAGEIFNPNWLALIEDVRQIRFMDWMQTNSSTIISWDDRPQVDDFSYSGGDFGRGTAGVPVEVMVELANKIGADPWFNMPHMASDEYVEQFAAYVRDHLNPELVANVEYSNEPWNMSPGFGQSFWMAEQATALWGSDAINTIPPTNLDYQVMRATQVAVIWDEVFGEKADARVKNVFNLQNGNAWWLENRILNGLVWQTKDPDTFVNPASVIDAVAVTTYFGGIHLADDTKRAELKAYLESHTVEQTYDWLADRMREEGAIDTIPTIATYWANVKAAVDKEDIELIAYEGGQHAHMSTSDAALGDFFIGFVRSQQMADLYSDLWDAWSQVSDGPFMQFVDVSAPSQYGSWGLISDLDDVTPRADFLFDKNAQQNSWFGDGGGARYQQGVIKIAGNGGETLAGTNKDDTLVGGDGDDILIPGLGNDKINGGKGNDTYQIGAASPYIVDGAGVDTIVSSISRDLNAYPGIENLTLTGTANINATGNGLANILVGNKGNNILDGGAGNDTLDGGAGNDTYILGDGNDTIIDVGGLDIIISSISRDLNNYPDIENLTLIGMANINATGNVRANVLIGNDGDNVLEGNGGADTLIGGLGNDTYVITNATNDTIIDVGGDDTIVSISTRDLRNYAGIENLTLTFGAHVDGTGTDGANRLTGNLGNNVLRGLGGNDVIDGGIGNDTLEGGDGDDTLYGGAGNDILDGGAGTDTLYGGVGSDTYVLADGNDSVIDEAGTDTIVSSISRNLNDYPDIENLTLIGTANINATGNVKANVLIGNDGDNVLDGGGGADTLKGGLGNDTYVLTIATNDTIYDVGGIDTITSGATRDLRQYFGIENLTLISSASIDAHGNQWGNVLTGNSGANSLWGYEGNDMLYGGAGADTLYGGAGNDTLDGGAGADTLYGGAGTDTYVLGDGDDTIVEESGWDTIISSISRNLNNYPDIENLTLTGTANINATGNVWSNVLIGNDGDNVLEGGGGADTLIGGLGNDTYVITNATNDTIIDIGGDDTIVSISTRDLRDYTGIENLTLTFGAHAEATGTDGANRLTGNSGSNILRGLGGDDILDGGAGNDTLEGGMGTDRLIGGTGRDIFRFEALAHSSVGAGRDIIVDFAKGQDTIDLSAIAHDGQVLGTAGAAFSNTANEIRWYQIDTVGTDADVTRVELDADGDGVADFQLELNGLHQLARADFLL